MGIMLSHPLFILLNMATKTAPRADRTAEKAAAPIPEQGRLHLVIDETRTPWRLDESTREIGRKGLAHAREVLRSTRQSEDLSEAA